MSEQLKILNEFYNNNKDNKLILSKEEIKQKMNKWLSSSEYYLNKEVYEKYFDEIVFGIDDGLCFTKTGVGYHDGTRFTFSEVEYMFSIISVHPVFEYSITGKDVKKCLFNLKEREKLFLNLKTTLLDPIKKVELEIERLVELEKIKKSKEDEKNRLIHLKKSKNNIINEFDVDGNGVIDLVEGNDFNLLLKRHQKQIIEIDRDYVHQFVKVSSYLKNKQKNIQLIFDSIKDTSSQQELKDYVGILKNEIHSYKLILFNSLNIIVSLVEDDMITFYEIYESFDKLNIFNSNWEIEVS